MAQVLLLNPKRRGRKGRKHRAKARRVTLRKRRSNPRRRRAIGYTMGSSPVRRRKLNPSRRKTRIKFRRRRSNPSFRGLTSSVMPTLKAGFVGAVGAIGVDVAWSYGSSYLPAQLQSGMAMYAAKLAAAIGVGMLANKVKPGIGRDIAVGGVTVVLHDAMRDQLAASFPQLNLGKYIGYAPVAGTAQNSVRAIPGNLGMYIPRRTLSGFGTMGQGAGGGSSYNYEDGIR